MADDLTPEEIQKALEEAQQAVKDMVDQALGRDRTSLPGRK